MPSPTLFGRGFRLGQGVIKPEEAPPGGDKSQAGQRVVNSAAGGSATPGAAGGGFRGMFMRKNLPRTLQILAAGLQDINGSGNLAAFQDNEADQQRLAAVEGAQARQTKIGDEQRMQLEQAISSLPPEQQTWARVNPEAFMQSLMRSQMDNRNNGWNVGQGYSHAFRIGPDGRVIQGDALPLRPRAPNMGYVMPGDVEEWDYANE